MTGLKYILFFISAKANQDFENCEIVKNGTYGIIKSSERETVTCPSWYRVWQGYNNCYPPKAFNWCWKLEPECPKIRVKFTKFAVEEQSKALHNYHAFVGEDVCIDRVKINTKYGYHVFCDESHQNPLEYTSTENKDFDPLLTGWFDWKELETNGLYVTFQSKELGAAGSSNFAGFDLTWECIPEAVEIVKTVGISTRVSVGTMQRNKDLGQCSSCDPNAVCVDGKCICDHGYTGSGHSCISLFGKCHHKQDIQCGDNAHCFDVLGSENYECLCKGTVQALL